LFKVKNYNKKIIDIPDIFLTYSHKESGGIEPHAFSDTICFQGRGDTHWSASLSNFFFPQIVDISISLAFRANDF